MINFDTTMYERPIRAPVLDTLRLGAVNITGDDLRDKWVPAGNQRYNRGEHAPILLGHTRDDNYEVDKTPVVGMLTGPFVYHDTHPNVSGPCMSGLHWIRKEMVLPLQGVPVPMSAREMLERFNRRSGELWLSDHKIDPHCMLGPTTPCREMGPLRLAAGGQQVLDYEIAYPLRLERDMADDAKKPEPKDEKPMATDKDAGPTKMLEAILAGQQRLEALISELLQAPPVPGAEGGTGAHPDDAEMQQLLAQLSGGQGDAEPPKKQPDARNAREPDPEVADLRVKVRRMEVEKDLSAAHVTLPAAEVEDLLLLPPDAYGRTIDRLRLSRAPASPPPLTGIIARANEAANPDTKKRVATPEDTQKIVRLARDSRDPATGKFKLDFRAAAEQLGYTVDMK